MRGSNELANMIDLSLPQQSKENRFLESLDVQAGHYTLFKPELFALSIILQPAFHSLRQHSESPFALHRPNYQGLHVVLSCVDSQFVERNPRKPALSVFSCPLLSLLDTSTHLLISLDLIERLLAER